MVNNELTLNVRVGDLERQVAELKGALDQQNKSIAAGNRMTNWQFIGFVLVMSGTLFGSMYWATGVLERRIDQTEKNLTTRIEQSEKNINARFEDMNARFGDMNARFEDLRQVVLSQQRQPPPKR
ncbi:MAG: hypothetical protein ACRD9Y_25035 [Blastocatellia bacterium]